MNLNELENELEKIFEDNKVVDHFSKSRVLAFSKNQKKKISWLYFIPITLVAILLLLIHPSNSLLPTPAEKNEVFTEIRQQEYEVIKKENIYLQERLDKQKELFFYLIEETPTTHYKDIAKELISYSLTLNGKRYSSTHNRALKGEFKLVIGQMYSEIYMENIPQELIEVFNNYSEGNAFNPDHIQLVSNHSLEFFQSDGTISMGIGFYGKDSSLLKNENEKIIIEVSPFLKEALDLNSQTLTIPIMDNPYEPLNFINDDHQMQYEQKETLQIQTNMLDNALQIMIDIHPNKKQLLDELDALTTFTIYIGNTTFEPLNSITNSDSVTVVTHLDSHLTLTEVTDYINEVDTPSLFIQVNNPMVIALPEASYHEYINELSKEVVVRGLNNQEILLQVEKNYDYHPRQTMFTSRYFNTSLFSTLTFSEGIINRTELRYKTISLFNKNFISTDLEETFTNLNEQSRTQFTKKKELFDYLLDFSTDADLQTILNQLISYEVVIDGIPLKHIAKEHQQISTNSTVEIVELISPVLLDTVHPKIMSRAGTSQLLKLQEDLSYIGIEGKLTTLDEGIQILTISNWNNLKDTTIEFNEYQQKIIQLDKLEITNTTNIVKSSITDIQKNYNYLTQQLNSINLIIDELYSLVNEEQLMKDLFTLIKNPQLIVDEKPVTSTVLTQIVNNSGIQFDIRFEHPYRNAFTTKMNERFLNYYSLSYFLEIDEEVLYTHVYLMSVHSNENESRIAFNFFPKKSTLKEINLTWNEQLVQLLNLPSAHFTLKFE